jgi:hypothetical protein
MRHNNWDEHLLFAYRRIQCGGIQAIPWSSEMASQQ